MITCGLKVTHDGAVALLDDDELIFSIEMEKLDNNLRYSRIVDLNIVPELLASFGYRVSDVDEWVIDGWNGRETANASVLNNGVSVDLKLAPYRENDVINGILQPGYVGEFHIGNDKMKYTSYFHLAGHLASAYCSSPFAVLREPSFVLVWDGGTFPRIYYVDPDMGVTNGNELFPLVGGVYPTAALHFGPFRRSIEPQTVEDLSIAGKLMAYIALGKARPEIVDVLRTTFHESFEAGTPAVAEYRRVVGGWGIPFDPSLRYLHAFFRTVRERLIPAGWSDEDVLASVHQFLEDLLVERITTKIRAWKGEGNWNLCFAGGCALNIKWNSALRAHELFRAVWIPPFPNDSGSAIGTAATHLMAKSEIKHIRWHVRLGPAVKVPALKAATGMPPGWRTAACSPEELAYLMHKTGDPVVVVNGRAELGPRALGGRSILAPATDPDMKGLLNSVKDREHYRPVAPVCLTQFAPDIFDPGTPDPYMLFDHKVRREWVERIPAVLHIDGTARVQTVSQEDDPFLEAVLREYYRLSDIPVLCNTSANYNGRGFFPDVCSAMDWGRVHAVWSDGVIYYHQDSGKKYEVILHRRAASSSSATTVVVE